MKRGHLRDSGVGKRSAGGWRSVHGALEGTEFIDGVADDALEGGAFEVGKAPLDTSSRLWI